MMASLGLLWGLVNGLQIVTFLMFFNIPMPANVLILQEVLYEIATFNLIPLGWLKSFFDDMLGDLDNNKEVDMSSQARETKYHRTNPIYNLLVPIFFTVLDYLLLLLLYLASRCSRKASKYYFKNNQEMYWNYYIRLLLECSIAISLACMVKMYALDFSNVFEGLSSLFAITMLLITIIFPIIATRCLWKLHGESY